VASLEIKHSTKLPGSRVYALQRGYCIASFPGRSHLQYLIAYSMQIRRWKAWEISSRVVTSGRQKVDTWGAVPDQRNLEALSCTIGSRAGGQSVSKAVSIPSVVHSAFDGSTRNGNYYCRAPPDQRNLEALSCTIGLRAGGQSVSKAVSIPSVVHSAFDGSTRNGNYCTVGHRPPCVYHLSTLHNHT